MRGAVSVHGRVLSSSQKHEHLADRTDVHSKQGIRVTTGSTNWVPSGLVDHVDRFLRHGIEGSHCLGVRLESALRDNQIGELLRDVDIRGLRFRPLQSRHARRARDTHRRAPRGGGGLINRPIPRWALLCGGS